MASTPERLTVHGYDWQLKTEADENGKDVIHCWALDRESGSYLLRFHDFPAFCHLELPMFIGNSFMRWTPAKAGLVVDYLKFVMNDNGPVGWKLCMKEKLYNFSVESLADLSHRRKYPVIFLMFNTHNALRQLKNRCAKAFKIRGLGMVQCRARETNFDSIRKLLTVKKISHSQWFTITGVKVTGEDKISTLVNEYIVDRRTMTPLSGEETNTWSTYPGIVAFDIETYSDRHEAFPKKYVSAHVAFSISCIYQRVNKPETRINEIIVFGDCDDIPDATVVRVNNELDMIDAMSDFIIRHDPEIITGYNIYSFDYPYLNARLVRMFREWKPMGRLINGESKMKNLTWNSSGASFNDINTVIMDGRISMDIMPMIKRDHKLPQYTLDAVAKFFLGRGKHDVKAKDMFIAFENQQRSYKKLTSMLIELNYNQYRDQSSDTVVASSGRPTVATCKDVGLSFDRIDVMDIYQWLTDKLEQEEGQVEGQVEEGQEGQEGQVEQPGSQQYNDVVTAFNQYMDARTVMTKVMAYCIEDSALCLDMFDKMNTWIGLVQVSNVVGVKIFDIYTRGQQERTTSSLYNMAYDLGVVIDERKVPLMSYGGGFVYDPIPGLYKNVPCLDFKSLYPTIMSAYNICYTTFVPPELMDKIPDDKCHVIEWEEDNDDFTGSDDEDLDIDDEAVTRKKSSRTIKYRYKFVKEPKGIVPRMVEYLINTRDQVKAQLKQEKNPIARIVLDQRQLALKISANSIYGGLGAQKGGKLPLPEAAACITAKSRESIMMVNNYLLREGHQIVYGDTDSSMPDVGITDPKTAHAQAKYWAERITKLFPPPMLLEDENVYGRLLCICKKKYAALKLDRDGNLETNPDNMQVKGIVLARRDNCKWQTDTYRKILWNILTDVPMAETFDYLIDRCIKLASGDIKMQEMTMIKGLGQNYKSASYFMKIFSDELARRGKPAKAGDRLQFVVVKTWGVEGDQKLGYKMRLPDEYLDALESDKPEPIDVDYYLNNVLKNCVQQLFSVGYNRQISELKEVYLANDVDWVIRQMTKFYPTQTAEYLEDNDGDKMRAIDAMIADCDRKENARGKIVKKIVKTAKQFHRYRIMGRKYITSRLDDKPVEMMHNMIKRKRELCKEINSLVHVSEYQEPPPVVELNVV